MTDFETPCIIWRRSTASGGENCLEVAVVDRSVLIRDSVNPGGVVLSLSPAAWSAFLLRARQKNPG